MKKIILSIAAVSALAAAAAPAMAQGWNNGRWAPIGARKAMLDERIDRGVRSGQLSRGEADRLYREFASIERREMDYRRGGLSSWERQDLDRRFDRLSAQIRYERNDRDYGYGYGDRYRR
jgi:Ni/Co efflux regulator RcnB